MRVLKVSGEPEKRLIELQERLQEDRGIPVPFTHVVGEACARMLRSLDADDRTNGAGQPESTERTSIDSPFHRARR